MLNLSLNEIASCENEWGSHTHAQWHMQAGPLVAIRGDNWMDVADVIIVEQSATRCFQVVG